MITALKCQKCSYEWVARVAAPKKCPACGQRNWQGEQKAQEENRKWQ